MDNLPKLLIVARGAWDDSKGTSSTLSNLFSNYDPDKLAMIYVESKRPNTACCKRFFQIPEIQLVKKFFRLGASVGSEVEPQAQSSVDVPGEEDVLNFVRAHRSRWFSWMREILWLSPKWKSKRLRQFIEDFGPDAVWIDGSTNIFLDRLYAYVLKVANKPGIIYLMDDNYTWKSMTGHGYLYHYLHRRSMSKVVSMCKKVLVISPKMKREFDEIFQVNSTIITKGIDYSNLKYEEPATHAPVRLLYMGQIIYGRDYTLSLILKKLAEMNEAGVRIEFSIYTNNFVPKQLDALIQDCKGVKLHKAVPYNEVPSVIAENDVLLFMESLSPKFSRDARLSFSTKITDYLASGKCIFAVGPEDSAPMDYFQEENCAIIAHNEEEIAKGLKYIAGECDFNELGKKSFLVGKKNHDKGIMERRLKTVLNEI